MNKQRMVFVSKVLKWGGIVGMAILVFSGFSVISNVSGIQDMIASSIGGYDNYGAVGYINDAIGTFGSLGWFIVIMGLVLGGLSIAMSMILEGMVQIVSGDSNPSSSNTNVMTRVKDIYNYAKDGSKNTNTNTEHNDQLKI